MVPATASTDGVNPETWMEGLRLLGDFAEPEEER
jgi:hypothetical protein